jgi:hypothetical protein
MTSSLAPQRNHWSSSETMTSDASQSQRAPKHLVRRLSISSSTARHPSPSLTPSSISNTNDGNSSSPDSQDPEIVVPTPTAIPEVQNYGSLNPYGQTTHAQSQDQNQMSPFEGIEPACGVCSDSLRVLVGSSPAEATWHACPFCTMFPLHSPAAGGDEDLYNA